ncbi:glycosyltransferase family 2 protein [Patescibacteria group bacterium]|nr:glycosyltransferase family 2 protein [Patescibacteria group bacterium]MBU1074845.1 glycosyltransferase family 2 protein [Patescibacteria group bacterium]MBU1951827.1 glycosyltransferase family 2 protein [Patescibacteria group bacterium]
MKIGIVVLNWNGLADTRECLESLKQINYDDFFVTVIDNGSDNYEAQKIKDDYGKFAEIISLPDNLGYAKGNNLGIQQALKQGADAVLLLNNDVTTVEKDFLGHLAKKLMVSGIGIVGPKILYYHKKDRVWFGGGDFHWWTGLVFHRGEGELDNPKYGNEKKATFITGCSMLVKREVFEKVGILDEEYPLYWEDADFCYRTIEKGFDLWYVPQSKIWHKVSQSVGEGSPKRTYFATRSRFIFMKKHLSKFQWIIFSIIFTFYKIPIKIFRSIINGNITNLNSFFKGIIDGLKYKIH